ncbi:MAG TPA: hypothetical protein VGP68_17260 [Gemmataceae bacterium]|nr:hypothetical protein [Gemmataceae bacterium]
MSWVKAMRLLVVLVGGAVISFGRADDAQSLDDEGFVKEWLLLAPIPLADGEDAGAAVDKQQVKEEAKLEPKDGDKVDVGAAGLVWKKYTAKEHYFDFNDFLGKVTEQSVGYAVTYVVSEAEIKDAVLKIGSDDQAKVYLNGQEVGKVAEARALEKDQNSYEGLTLKKGSNTLVFKVINEGADWSGCARFTDKDGKPLKSLKVELKK